MNFIIKIWEIMTALGEANYAAHLARNGQWKRAQKIVSK
jgi:hypothetical protein